MAHADALGGASNGAKTKTALHLGVDLGTNTTVLSAAHEGVAQDLELDIVKSVVGFPKQGIIPGILPTEAGALFGDEAIDYRLHLDLNWPLHEGFVHDLEACKLFTSHLRHVVDPHHEHELWGVVGAPANASTEREKDIRAVADGFLDRLLIVPEPFLAAMGLRDDEGFKRAGSCADPTRHSLIVDIGAGTTDLCLVRGYFPTSEDLICLPVAGDSVDDKIDEAIQRRYPDIRLTRVTLRDIKEKHSFVTGHDREAEVKVYVDGRPRVLNFADMIRDACDLLVPAIVDGIQELLKRCDSESAIAVMENIIVTGGGSQIQGVAERVQEVLHEREFDCARCIAPTDYKRLVANGALKVAENVREDQWQFLV
ncbi:MAG: rod shape-determining protein [Planctomycetota bacterium]